MHPLKKIIIIINKNSHSLPLNWQVQAGHFFQGGGTMLFHAFRVVYTGKEFDSHAKHGQSLKKNCKKN